MTAQIQNSSNMQLRLNIETLIRIAAVILVLALIWAVALFLQQSWQVVNFPFPVDYGEGHMLDEVMRSVQGISIYKNNLDKPPFDVANYPPGYILAQMPFAAAFGPALWYGRVIAGASVILTALFIALTVQHLTKRWFPAVVGGLLMLALPHVLNWGVVAKPDTLALCLSWLGIFIIVRWPEKRWAFIISIIALMGAIYTRQSHLVAGPSVAFFWLLHRRGWRQAVLFVIAVGVIGGALFLILNVVTDGGFYFNTVKANVNEFRFAAITYHAKIVIRAIPLLLLIAAAYGVLSFMQRDESLWITIPYMFGALVSAVAIAKIGSHINYLLELMAALSLLTGLFITLILDRFGRRWIAFVILILLAGQVAAMNVQMGPLSEPYLRGLYDDLQNRLTEQPDLQRLYDRVENTEGTVLIDLYVGFLPLQNRPMYFQPFSMTQLTRDGLWDETPLIQRIENHEFPLIIIYHGWATPPDWMWSAGVFNAVDEHYVLVDEIVSNHIYEPKPSE